jgi:hypothetical protein
MHCSKWTITKRKDSGPQNNIKKCSRASGTWHNRTPRTPKKSFYCQYLWFVTLFVIGATSGPGNDYPSRAPEFTPDLYWVRVARSFVFCVVFCKSLFVQLSFCLWPLSVLRFTSSNYPFGIFKLFLFMYKWNGYTFFLQLSSPYLYKYIKHKIQDSKYTCHINYSY